MRELHFEYNMKLTFQPSVSNHRFTLKCVPPSTQQQIVEGPEVNIFPKGTVNETRDSFGNCCLYGFINEPHEEFAVRVAGTALTGMSECDSSDDGMEIMPFGHHTAITRPGESIRAFDRACDIDPDASNIDTALCITERLYECFTYEAGATTVETTAEQAMKQGRGVCQDYAHIMLSVLRMHHIPCRYVAGMLLGEGQSHAWVQVYDRGGWYGFDPTHNRRTDDSYITISVGRDCRDCSINRGVFMGNTLQTQQVSVRVWDKQYREV